jgi:acetolactate decarboxylase
VWDGTPFTSRIEQGAMHVAVDADAKAPFLVWSDVEEWSEVEVPGQAKTLAGFETWLPGAARLAGVDGSRPFAFLLLGAVDFATIHVVDLAPG